MHRSGAESTEICFLPSESKRLSHWGVNMDRQRNERRLDLSAKRSCPTGDLVTWLADRGIPILGTRHNAPCANGTATMYLVTCPWESDHTEAFGTKDTAVFEDPSNGHWCFNCFHAHCNGRGWEDFRAKVAPRDTISPEAYQSSRKPYSKTRARLNRTKTLYR